MITKLGLLFVYDLTTATAVYRNRISPDPIFLTANSDTTGGFYAINKCVATACLPMPSFALQQQVQVLIWYIQRLSTR